MDKIRLGSLEVSRFVIGGNPFSGFSHQCADLDRRMRSYFTVAQIKRLLHDAEALGVDTLVARADAFIVRLLMEYWNEGGRIQWVAQTCPEYLSTERSVQNAISGGAKAVYIHGGVMDNLYANNNLGEIPPAIRMIKAAGLPAGIAAHKPEVHRWAERELDVDFYMCSYYNPSDRAASAEGARAGDFSEAFDDEDRQAMVETLATLSKPVIHYKVLAAGRKTPAQAFAFVAKYLRPSDAVCVGVYDEDQPGMLREDVELFERSLAEV